MVFIRSRVPILEPLSPSLLRQKLGRRDLLMLLCAITVSSRLRAADPLLKPAGLNHINIRASNPTASAHFYQGLFGGELTWIESIPPNPFSPPAESWFLTLGTNYLSISPAFPELKLGPGLDHICLGLQDYEVARTAAMLADARLTIRRESAEVWLRDPDEILFQLRGDSTRQSRSAPKPGDVPARGPAPFVPLSIREITLRASDVERTGRFYATVFGGEVHPAVARGRTFQFGESVLRVVPSLTASRGFDRFGVAVKDFSADAARRLLREHGIEAYDTGRQGEVHLTDPDGVHIQLVAYNSTLSAFLPVAEVV